MSSNKIDLAALRRNLDLLRAGGSETFLCGIAQAEALVRLAEAWVERLRVMNLPDEEWDYLTQRAANDASEAALSPFLPGKEGA